MKTFKKYFTENDKLKAFKSFANQYEFEPIDGKKWFEEKNIRTKGGFGIPFGYPSIESYEDLNQAFGQPKRLFEEPLAANRVYIWGVKFKDGLEGAITSIMVNPPAVSLISDSVQNSKTFAKRIYGIFGGRDNLGEYYANLIGENNKFNAFKKYSQTYSVKNIFSSNLIFADDQPTAEANARETERRLAKEGMDFYIAELTVNQYKDLIDNFGEPNQSRDKIGMLYFDWGVEFGDGVKVIISIDPHDLYYDDQHNIEPESPIIAQITGPKGKDEEILSRLNTILNKK